MSRHLGRVAEREPPCGREVLLTPGCRRGVPRARRSLCGVTDPVEPGASRPARDPFRLVAGLLSGLQALSLVGVVAFYLWELGRGASDDATRVVMSAVLIAVFAALLAVVARGWLRGQDWPKTATVVWNVLLLPVAWSLVQADQRWVGVLLGAVALAGVVAAVGARTGEDVQES